jgi:hypothetical protein
MSALADSPGINRRSVVAPISQNGMERPSTSAKNFSGALFLKVPGLAMASPCV